MSTPIAIRFPDDLARFCAAGGHLLDPDAVVREAPDFSCIVEGAAGWPAVARCSLWWRKTPPFEKHNIGYIGHYAVANPSVAPALLEFACGRLAAAGRTLAVGPVDGSTWQSYRFVTERGAEPTFFLEPNNPDEWPGQFTDAGFTPLAQYYSALHDHLADDEPGLVKLKQRVSDIGVTIEPLKIENFDEVLHRVHELTLTCFQGNFLYSPIDEPDFLARYEPIRKHLRPDLVLLARRQSELVGFIFGIPNLAQAQRGQPIDTVVLKTMAVRPDHAGKGVGGLLMAQSHQAARAAGFKRVIHALFHEANRSGRLSGHTAKIIRRYTLFSRPLERRNESRPHAT